MMIISSSAAGQIASPAVELGERCQRWPQAAMPR